MAGGQQFVLTFEKSLLASDLFFNFLTSSRNSNKIIDMHSLLDFLSLMITVSWTRVRIGRRHCHQKQQLLLRRPSQNADCH